ncbi:MAG TPA: FecR domain-containing protein [Polyangiaceae bacterium]|nr:FecR domain-containing protein [Polyangiaceae bacterium]
MSPKNPLHELRRGVWPVQDADAEQRRRARIAERIVLVNRELSARERRQRPLRWLAAAAVLGSVCLLWALWRPPGSAPLAAAGSVQLVSGSVSVSQAGVLAPLGSVPIDVASEPILVTRADQSAELRLASAAALQLAGASEVGLERRQSARGFEERVHLRAGAVALRVPKLGSRGTLAVETRDSWVEVHGTRFSVRWVEQPPAQPFTEVDVSEGKVLVRGRDGASRMLGAGEHWRSNSAQAPALAAAPPPPQPPPLRPPPPQPPAAAPPRAAREPALAAPPPSPSELAAQNRLLEGAELARKSGMPALALERLDTLIERFPDAELAHNARVQRMRLLASMGRSQEAARAARQYLELYPRGFARVEAQKQLAAEAP